MYRKIYFAIPRNMNIALLHQRSDELRGIFLEQRQMPFIGIKPRFALREGGFSETSHFHRDVLIRFAVPELNRRLNVLQAKAVVRDREQGFVERAARPVAEGFAQHVYESCLEFGVCRDGAIRRGEVGGGGGSHQFGREANHPRHHPQKQARGERIITRQGEVFSRPLVDVRHQFGFSEQRRAADDSHFGQSFGDGAGARQTVNPAERVGKDGEAFDGEMIGEREQVVGKVEQAAVGLEIRESHAWAIHRDQADIQRAQQRVIAEEENSTRELGEPCR